MTKFDTDTGVERQADGTFVGTISADWSIVRGANGGHLAAILLRSMCASLSDDRVARSLTVHFARVPRNDAFAVEVTNEREGRTTSNLSARITQDGKLIALGIAVFATHRSGPDFDDLAMPEVPGPDDIGAVLDRSDFPFGRQFDFRHALGPPLGELSDRAEIGVWMRLREPQVLDTVSATQLMDAFAPAVFVKLGTGGGGAGVPTVEMTYHYRDVLPLDGARPDDWYLGVFRTMTSRGGFIEEDGWLWHRSGTLVAQSRQLAIVGGL